MQNVIGHTEQKDFILKNYTKSPTWLFAGKKGIGKYTTALAVAKHIFQFDSIDYHPDVMLIDGSTASMTKIREVKHFLQMTSISSTYKVAIIDNAEDLNENATNALLKTLEEPSEKSLIFLISHNVYSIPIVLQSRCMTLLFKELSYEESLQVIKLNHPDMKFIDAAAALYPGTPGMITEEIGNEISLYETIGSIINKKDDSLSLEKALKADLSMEKMEYLILKSVSDHGIKVVQDCEDRHLLNSENILNIAEKYLAILKIFSTSRKLNIQREATFFKVLEMIRSLVAKQ